MTHRNGRYLELTRSRPLQPIEDDEDLENAEAILQILAEAPALSLREMSYSRRLEHFISEYNNAAAAENARCSVHSRVQTKRLRELPKSTPAPVRHPAA